MKTLYAIYFKTGEYEDFNVWDFEYNDMCLTVDYTGAEFEIVELQFED